MKPAESAASEGAAFDGKAFARTLSNAPGVYRMLDAGGGVLYVGKAGSLKRRVSSYFSRSARAPRLQAMIVQIAAIEVTVTRSEGEALLLENQLIKSLKPRYNILLRDDKSYPYIRLTTDQDWPRIAFHRGARGSAGRYFGPFPGVTAVRETLNLMAKLFRLRSCEDSVFRNRSRPCLQHQIGRCSAPCVGLVSPEDYAASVRRAELFLEGRSDELVGELQEVMQRESAALAFERAARLRDLIADLRRVQAGQLVEGDLRDVDFLACVQREGVACVALLSLRGGRNLGTRAFFPRLPGSSSPGEVLAAFLPQYYLERQAPAEVVLSEAVEGSELLAEVLGQSAGRRVQIKSAVRSERARYLDLSQRNAEHALAAQLAAGESQRRRLDALVELLELEAVPQRIECFDISHTQGEATVASCVVFDAEGPVRAQYRRFNIEDVTAGDDFAAMRQALQRRFRSGNEGTLPDLLLIDGGKGQLRQAREVLQELGVEGMELVGVAKGEARRPGEETLIRPDGSSLRPGGQSPALHLIQQVRDEAHRFAITGHRGRRAKARQRSRLQDIDGIGAKRRAALLRHFGGLAGLMNAGIDDIAAVEGVGPALAQRLYHALHGIDPSPTASA
jgi:excinuclease ABC subunit C